jgi:hypothetical protein
MGESKAVYRFWWENLRGKDHLEEGESTAMITKTCRYIVLSTRIIRFTS